jgi:hypothetical protein
MFAPTSRYAYAIEALVYTRLEPLSSSNQTNWLTQNAPNAMLFGALKQMMLFLKDDQRLAVFKGMFDEAMSTLKTEDTLRVGIAPPSQWIPEMAYTIRSRVKRSSPPASATKLVDRGEYRVGMADQRQ